MSWFKALTTLILIVIKLIHLIPLIQEQLPKSRLGRALVLEVTGPSATKYAHGRSISGVGAEPLSKVLQELASKLTFADLNSTQMDGVLLSLGTALAGGSAGRNGNTNKNHTNLSRQDEDEPPEEECDGFRNAFEDIGLLTFLSDCFIQILALGLLIFAYVPQIYSYFSAYFIALPSIVLFVLEDTIPDRIEDIVDMIGIGDTMFDLLFNIPSNDLINVATVGVEWLSVVNIVAETFGTFPAFLDFAWSKLFGLDAEEYFRGYGCGYDEDALDLLNPPKPKSALGRIVFG